VTVYRGGEPASEFFPPHPSVRENLEQFARAALGQGSYPVSLEEMLANVHKFEAITRSAASGRIESVAASVLAPSEV
jgi:predicted dehydrogenase